MGGINDNKSDTIYDSIDFSLIKFLKDTSKFEFTDLNIMITLLETIRYNFSTKFSRMIFDSGSIVLRKPELSSAIFGLFYQISRDVDFDVLNHIEIIETSPHIIFHNIDQTYKNVQCTKTSIIDYISYCEETNNLVNYIHKEISKIIHKIGTIINNNHNLDNKSQYEPNNLNKNYNEINIKLKNDLRISSEILLKTNNVVKDIIGIREKIVIKREREKFISKFKIINKEAKFIDNTTLFLNFTESRDLYKSEDEWKFLFTRKILKNRLGVSPMDTPEYEKLKNEIKRKREIQEVEEVFGSSVKESKGEEERENEKEKRDTDGEIVLKRKVSKEKIEEERIGKSEKRSKIDMKSNK